MSLYILGGWKKLKKDPALCLEEQNIEKTTKQKQINENNYIL